MDPAKPWICTLRHSLPEIGGKTAMFPYMYIRKLIILANVLHFEQTTKRELQALVNKRLRSSSNWLPL